MAGLLNRTSFVGSLERARALIESTPLDDGPRIILLASTRAAADALNAVSRDRTIRTTPAGHAVRAALRHDAVRDDAHRIMTWLLIWQNDFAAAEGPSAIGAARTALPLSDAEFVRLGGVFEPLTGEVETEDAQHDAVMRFRRGSFDLFAETVTGRTWEPDPARARAESERAADEAMVDAWGRIVIAAVERRHTLITGSIVNPRG